MARDSTPLFQISIVGPPGHTFPSFKSTDLKDTGFEKFLLDNIRHKANISTKFVFTADGKTSISDDTTLEHYMRLSDVGQKILREATPNSHSEVQTFTVTLMDKTPTTTPAPAPDTSAVKELMDKVRTADFLARGELPKFADTTLAALTANYAATPNNNKDYVAPAQAAELTEAQWNIVLENTRAFHGYFYDLKKDILRKAPKPAFRLKANPIPGTAISESFAQDKYIPPIPPYYVFDSASVQVTEIREQIQDKLVKEGFDSLVVSASIGGGLELPVSVSESFEKEHATSHQEHHGTDVQNLTVTYNFPRVVVELGPEWLELTPECEADAKNAEDEEDGKWFGDNYGTAFATSFTLGGYLYSTRSVSEEENSKLDETKDKLRNAVGLSFTASKASGSFGIANSSGNRTETEHGDLHQTASLTWNGYGGDTLLVSNPNAWASTVKDHRLWRLMNQRGVMDLRSLVKAVNPAAHYKLTHPSTKSYKGIDPFSTQSGYRDSLRIKMQEVYTESEYGGAANGVYNSAMGDKTEAHIALGTTFEELTKDQYIGIGRYMVHDFNKLQGFVPE
ncbi:hypothetical protein D9757_005213 [Collybiopsis confluens]|uniref:MACPF-like domain-containing protein n=1 Tax=Collybiopsis confluens TaxID=2823264 RepID=A0A8H5HVQ9_9AGAR|nr:hypothetical protein D9757_005213 [Collybiopsis confluens]